MELLRLTKTRVTEDGCHVQTVFETDQGDTPIEVNAATLELIVGGLIRILADARKARHQTTLAETVEAAEVRATATKDHQSVVMDYLLHNGFEHRFDVPLPKARSLLVQLRDAVARCG